MDDFVYSSLSFYGPRWGGEIPGFWFVRALGRFGRQEAAIRQALFRMERAGALLGRWRGRVKLYRASPTTRVIIEAGTARILHPADDHWDGRWTLVQLRFDAATRRERDLVRDVLMMEGFATTGGGVYLHPRDRSARVREAVRSIDLADRVLVIRGEPVEVEPRRLALELWDLAGLRERYRRFLRRHTRFRTTDLRRLDSFGAAAIRFAVVFDFVRLGWDDPDLPPELLPGDWPGREAQQLTARLYRRLTPRALDFGNRMLRPTGSDVAVRRVATASQSRAAR